jgi:hypothetical protein
MKWISLRYVLPLLVIAGIAVGCKSALSDQVQDAKTVIDKDKDKTDDRSDAIKKMNDQASNPSSSSPN